MRKYFNLNKPYEFDINDIVALLYVACAVVGIIGLNPTPLFLIGSTIGVVTCYKAHKINLVVLNGSLFILNLVTAIKYFL